MAITITVQAQISDLDCDGMAKSFYDYVVETWKSECEVAVSDLDLDCDVEIEMDIDILERTSGGTSDVASLYVDGELVDNEGDCISENSITEKMSTMNDLWTEFN